MKTEEIYKKYYSEIPQKAFIEICKGDPTSNIKENTILKIGRYVKWLTKIYLERNLLLEDIEKANEYLGVLYGVRNHVKNIDIFDFDSLTSGKQPLFDFVSKYVKPNGLENESNLLTNKYFIVHKEADVLFEDSKWLVVSPKTKEASGFYGANSQWCTRNPNSFEEYNTKGKLFIFIVKDKVIDNISKTYSGNQYNLDNQRRFQYHIQSNQFLNNSDGNTITDEVIKLGFEVLQNEIFGYYNQQFSYDTFHHIIKKNFKDIRFEDAYKYILTSDSHHINSSITSYLKRFECDSIKMLENFNFLNPEEKGGLLNTLIFNDHLTNIDFTKTSIINDYFNDFDFNYFKKNLIVSVIKKKLDSESVLKYLKNKKISDVEIGEFLTAFTKRISDYGNENEYLDIYLKLLEKYSKLADSVLFPSIQEYCYLTEGRNRRYRDNKNSTYSDANFAFLSDTLKIKISCLCLDEYIRYELQSLMYGHGMGYGIDNFGTYNDSSLQKLLYKKGSDDVKISDDDCNLVYLLENNMESKDSMGLMALFLYLNMSYKSTEEEDKINQIIETKFNAFNALYVDVYNLVGRLNDNLNYKFHWGLNMMFYKYENQIRNILKGEPYESVLNNEGLERIHLERGRGGNMLMYGGFL